VWEEEYPLPGYQTSTENYVAAQFIGLGLFSSWMVAGDFPGGPAIAASIGALSLFFYFFYSREGAISTTAGKRYFRRWSLVPIIVCIIWSVSQFQPVISSFNIGEREYLHLVDRSTAGPVTSITGAHWTTLLYPCLIMLGAVGLVAFTQSQHAIARILMVLSKSAMILAAIGAIGAVFHWKKILTFITPAQENFYSVFPTGHQWSAFALFWTVVGFGVLLHVKRRNNWRSLLSQGGVWWIIGWLLLAGSVYWTGAPVHRFLLGVGVGLLMLSTGAAMAGKARSGVLSALIGAILGLAGLGLTGYSFLYFASVFNDAQTNVATAPFGIPWEIQTALWRDSWALFEQRPLFGWGAGSFADIFPFQQQIDLNEGHYISPHSDLLQGLVEYGVIGMALWLLFPLGLMVQFVRLSVRRRLSHYLWGGATLLALLAFVSQPLSTPATYVSLWIGLAAAYKWSQAAEEAEKTSAMARQFSKKPEGSSRSSSRKGRRRSRRK